MTQFHRDRPWFTSGSLLVFTVLCVSTRVPHGFPTESPPRPTCSPPPFPRPPAATCLLLLRGWLFPERRRAGVMQVAGAREERRLSSSDTRSRFPCLLAARQPLSLSAGHCSGSGWAAAGPSAHLWEGVRVAFKCRQLRMQLLETRGCVCVAVLSGSSG